MTLFLSSQRDERNEINFIRVKTKQDNELVEEVTGKINNKEEPKEDNNSNKEEDKEEEEDKVVVEEVM
jgi:hypothetical protein